MKIPLATLFTFGISAVAIGTILLGITMTDSPTDARMHKLDARRVSDLQHISWNISGYYKTHKVLPATLSQLNANKKELKDPVSGQPYEYKVSSATSYTLCAVFELNPEEEDSTRLNEYSYSQCAPNWQAYNKGTYCFTLSAMPCR